MTDYVKSLDNILIQINEPTLTDDEVLTLNPSDPESLQEKYDILYRVLQTRGGGQSLKKLKSNSEVNNITIDRPKKDYSNMLFCFGRNNTGGFKQ